MKSAIALPICLLLASCSGSFTAQRPPSYYQTNDVAALDSAAASLFDSDAALLDDAAIARILAVRYEPPALSRVALLPFGWSAWSGWSEEMALATVDVEDRVLGTLRASPRIYDAALLPSILVPEKRTVPYLREAAARYQADLLLLFRSQCRSFERYRLFAADRSRAFCAVESVLLDIRTGLVPFVASATRNYDVEESSGDLSFRETQLRAQLGAVAGALGEVSTAVVGYLDTAAP